MDITLEDHVVLFLDFLGFSEASVQSDPSTQNALLQLLSTIASLRANFSREVTKNEGGHSIRFRPAVSTFSDNIVISFPFSQLSFDNSGGHITTALHQAENYISWIARNALINGFLVRGGISLGKLYHSDGVVFGPAMVEAYNLESRTSVYPRVVLSSVLLNDPEVRRDNLFLRNDTDGLISVEYFRSMILSSASPGDDYAEKVNRWLDLSLAIVKSNIQRLSGANNMNARSKWVWFAGRIYETLDKYAQIFDHFVPGKKNEWKSYTASL